MSKQDYSHGTFQEKYISRCIKLGEPLSEKQTGALEDTINTIFRGRTDTDNIPSQPFDREFLFNMPEVDERVAASIYQHLESYVRMKEDKSPRDPVSVTETDAVEFYNRINPPQGVTPQRARYFGTRKKEILENYLIQKGCIKKPNKKKSSE